MNDLVIEKRAGLNGNLEVWVQFLHGEKPWLIRAEEWVGFDFDGVLAIPDPSKPYNKEDLGVPVREIVNKAKALIEAGITVKVFTARACSPHMLPKIQDWTEENGLGRLEVTNMKDYALVRFYDDRAIQVVPPR